MISSAHADCGDADNWSDFASVPRSPFVPQGHAGANHHDDGSEVHEPLRRRLFHLEYVREPTGNGGGMGFVVVLGHHVVLNSGRPTTGGDTGRSPL